MLANMSTIGAVLAVVFQVLDPFRTCLELLYVNDAYLSFPHRIILSDVLGKLYRFINKFTIGAVIAVVFQILDLSQPYFGPPGRLRCTFSFSHRLLKTSQDSSDQIWIGHFIFKAY